ncbi:alpha/beta fold hydrolase [Gordonia humi]|uniref:Pimeloyl-ACP methyl ester carboxylesterase n=1 Tax=Gordonia humi TaxID=686429 RepID=A0A840ELE6_9ACTN|nr:pimeloyl-ACP methyl ester carboxylesterase [Gordonia humi]
MVLVHGAMDTGGSFSRLVASLTDVDTITYDRRGYGDSHLDGRMPNRIAEHADDLLSILDGRPSVVMAHSLGGLVALAAAQRDPSVFRGLVAYETPMPWLPWWPPVGLPADVNDIPQVTAAATRFLRAHMGDERWAALTDTQRDGLLTCGPAWATELSDAQNRGPVFEFAQIAVPVLAVHGSLTDDRHVNGARVLARSVPNGRLATIEGAGHIGHRRQPAELASLIVEQIAATANPQERA